MDISANAIINLFGRIQMVRESCRRQTWSWNRVSLKQNTNSERLSNIYVNVDRSPGPVGSLQLQLSNLQILLNCPLASWPLDQQVLYSSDSNADAITHVRGHPCPLAVLTQYFYSISPKKSRFYFFIFLAIPRNQNRANGK